jgi:hypothetical protein
MHINFDSSLLEAFEELDKLQEDTTNKEASKQFWAAAKEGIADDVAFHAAFDTELEELGLKELFLTNGYFKHRNVYEQIKAAKIEYPDSWAVRALNKLWVLVYIDKIEYKSIKDAREKFRAEQQAKEEAERAAHDAIIKAWKDALVTAVSKVDPDELKQFLAIENITADQLSVKILKTTMGIKQTTVWYVSITVAGDTTSYSKRIDVFDAENKVEILEALLNQLIPSTIKGFELETKRKSNDVIDIFKYFKTKTNYGWYNPLAIALGDSGKMYNIAEYAQLPGQTVVSVSEITEPFRVIYTKISWSDGNHRTIRDSVGYSYHSWDSSEEARLADVLPTFGKKQEIWSEHTTTEDSGNDDMFSHMDNIDTWAKTKHVAYATD